MVAQEKINDDTISVFSPSVYAFSTYKANPRDGQSRRAKDPAKHSARRRFIGMADGLGQERTLIE